LNSFSKGVSVLSKEIVQDGENEKHIKVKIETGMDEEKQINEYTYKLRKENEGWKVMDYIDEEGALLSESIDLKNISEERNSFFDEYEEIFLDIANILKEAINSQKKLNEFRVKIINVLKDDIPTERLKAVSVNKLKDDNSKFVVLVAYIFEDAFLADKI